jgi:hypothetical protein
VRSCQRAYRVRDLTCGDAACVQVAASVFLDLVLVRGGIEMEIELVTIGVQPVGIVSLKDGASRPPGFDEPDLDPFANPVRI